ncbi:MAG: LOG family protein [Terrimicrobiaceae bacterium]
MESPREVLPALNRVRALGLPDAWDGHVTAPGWGGESFEGPLPDGHNGNVCVFCSASLKDPDYLEDGRALGRLLAGSRMGCVSGAGSSGVMGEVVRGAVEAGGWTGGSNVPHIIEIEGLPDGLSSFWLRPDIYTRMEIMIQKSDAFVIFPGGAGTVQEMLALLILKEKHHPHMEGKPVFVFNRVDTMERSFWGPLIDLLSVMGEHTPFTVIDDLDSLLPGIMEKLADRDLAA